MPWASGPPFGFSMVRKRASPDSSAIGRPYWCLMVSSPRGRKFSPAAADPKSATVPPRMQQQTARETFRDNDVCMPGLYSRRLVPLHDGIEDKTRNGILRTLSYFVYRNPLEAVSLARPRFTISSMVFLLKSGSLPIR